VAYLYKIDAAGTQDYLTIQAAVTQAEADWNGVALDGPVEFRIWAGTYTEQITIDHTLLAGTAQYPLRFWAQGTVKPVLDYSAANAIFKPSSNVACLSFKGLSLEHNRNWYVIELVGSQGPNQYYNDCYVTGGGGTISMLHAGHKGLVGVNTEFAVREGAHNGITKGGGVCLLNCKMYWRAASASNWNWALVAGDVSAVGCLFDGTNKSAVNYGLLEGFYSSMVRNCVFKGGNYGVAKFNTHQGGATLINNIFTGQTAAAIHFPTAFESPHNLQIEANVFHDMGGAILVDHAGTYNDIAALQAAGYDVRNKCITSDPKLDDPLTGKIASDSPCVMAGIGAGAYQDAWGETFDSKTPSIGMDAQHDLEVVPTFTGDYTVVANTLYNRLDIDISGCYIVGAQSIEIYARQGAAPTTADYTYLVGMGNPADATIYAWMQPSGLPLSSGDPWHIKLVARNAEGIAVHADTVQATAHGYLTVGE